MELKVIFGLVILPAVIAADDGEELTTFMRKTLENFRSKMTEGIPELDVPVLDPYVLEDVTIEEKNDKMKLTAALRSVKIFGLSKFDIIKLHVDPTTLEAEIALQFESVRGEGEYELDGVVFSIFPLTGNGKFWLQANQIISQGRAAFSENGSHLKIEELKLDLHAEEISGQFENILGGGELGEIVNNLLNKFGQKILNAYSEEFMAKVTDSFKNNANLELEKIPIVDLLPHHTTVSDMTTF